MLPPVHFRAKSYGQVLGPDGTIKAESSISGVYKLAIAKHTTQADFEVNKDPFSANISSYPENVHSAGTDTVLERTNTGSGLGGQLAISTKTFIPPIADEDLFVDWHFGFPDDPDDSTRGKYDDSEDEAEFTVENEEQGTGAPEFGGYGDLQPGGENDPHFPFPFMTREYNDVSDDCGENFGLVGGKWNSREDCDGDGTTDYPWDESDFNPPDDLQPAEDPYNYADVTPDGALMTSERYRSIRFLTTNWDCDHLSGCPAPGSGTISPNEQRTAPNVIPTRMVDNENNLGSRNQEWAFGHVEFWWKPRAATFSATGAGTPERDSTRIIFPLWSHWIMTLSSGVDPIEYLGPHKYEDALYHDDNFQGSHPDQETDGIEDFHGYTQQSNYDWKLNDGDDTSYPPWDPVQATDAGRNLRYERASGATDPATGVARPPVDDTQRWAGYDCDYMDGYSREKYRNGQGTIARLSMESGCLTAYPGIQFNQGYGFPVPGSTGGRKSFEALGGTDQNGDDIGFRSWVWGGMVHTWQQPRAFYRRHGALDGDGIQAIDEREYVGYHKFFDNTGHGGTPGYTDTEFSLGFSHGWYFRAFYIKEPAGSSDPSRWVFKISQEAFMDMDVGLRKNVDPFMSPPVTTDWRTKRTGLFNGNQWGNTGSIQTAGWNIYDWSTSNPRKQGGDSPYDEIRDPNGDGSGDDVGQMCVGSCFSPGESIATLNATTPSTKPIPGKWTHVTLEWDIRDMYHFRGDSSACTDGVGCGTSYPIFVPWDYYDNTSFRITQPLSSPNYANEITNDAREDWLPIVQVPEAVDKNIFNVGTRASAGNSTTSSRRAQAWVVPHISVNGVKKDKTDLYMGNINPNTGQFQPPFLLYAEHVVWEGGSGPSSERMTAWWYLQHWTYKHFGQIGQFGSNLARRTKHYGEYTLNGNQKVRYNWARFYDDGFIGGTVDELLFTNDHPGGSGPFEAYYEGRYVDPSTVSFSPFAEHIGRFHRGSTHDHSFSGDPLRSGTYWDTNGNNAPDRFNEYAKVDQRLLVGGQDETINILKVAHTQYRPMDDSNGRDYTMQGNLNSGDDLNDSDRPYFKLEFKSEGGSWPTRSYSSPAAPNSRWLGEPVQPEELTSSGTRLQLGPGDDLMYRITPQNYSTPINITPFFEDLTIMYSGSTATGYGQISYYTP